MPTNHLGQQTTDGGHVIKESERIGNSIRDIYYHTMKEPIFPPLNKALTAYVLDYAHTNWSKNVNMGIALGHKDAIRMLQSLQYNTYYTATNKTGMAVQAVPLDELQKVIAALEGTA